MCGEVCSLGGAYKIKALVFIAFTYVKRALEGDLEVVFEWRGGIETTPYWVFFENNCYITQPNLIQRCFIVFFIKRETKLIVFKGISYLANTCKSTILCVDMVYFNLVY